MSLARVRALLGIAEEKPNPYYVALGDGIAEEAAAARAVQTVHTAQQALVLQHLQEKLAQNQEALVNLKDEMSSIKKLNVILEHIHMSALFFRSGNAESETTIRNEMKEIPELLRGYEEFHAWLENATRYKASIEAYLKTKPPFDNATLQGNYTKLKKEYESYKNSSNLDRLLETYQGYDINVSKIIALCKPPVATLRASM